MKKVILLAAFGALFSSCKKEEKKCEIWTYNEIVVSKKKQGCVILTENAYGAKKTFCGDDLNGVAPGTRVLDKQRSNDCYNLYTDFVEKD